MYKEDNHFVEAFKVRSRPKALAHEVFLDENIAESEYYRNVLSLLRNGTQEGDDVEIYISNGGGLVHTASSIKDAMKACPAKITGFLNGEVCSAATAIMLDCDDWVVGNDLFLMIHNVSYAVGGKATDIHNQQTFTKQWGDKMFRTTYEGFLTEEEIEETILHGKEHWFGSEEVVDRLSRYSKHRQDKQMKALESEMESQFEEEDAFVGAAITVAQSQGLITEEEAVVARKMQTVMDEVFDNHKEDIEKVMEEGVEVEDKSLSTFKAKDVVILSDTEINSFIICDRTCEDFGVISYELDEGEITSVELELLDEEETLYPISHLYLSDLPKSELKDLCYSLGIEVSKGASDVRMAQRIVEEIDTEIKAYIKNHE